MMIVKEEVAGMGRLRKGIKASVAMSPLASFSQKFRCGSVGAFYLGFKNFYQ